MTVKIKFVRLALSRGKSNLPEFDYLLMEGSPTGDLFFFLYDYLSVLTDKNKRGKLITVKSNKVKQ